jgi:phosphate:Na+ symporter
MLPAAFVAIFAGVLPYFTGKDRRALRVGQALIGFGCIFVGISYMSSSFLPLREIPGVSSALSHLGAIPILGIIAGTLLAALLQSSSVFLAIVISMAGQGLISTPAILALVMGAHIGGTMTTLISSLGANHIDAKRVAVCNTFYRVTAALLLYPFITPFSRFAELMSVGAQGEVASAYLWTTIFMVLIFLPFNKLLAGLLTKLMPDVAAARGERHLLYIRPGAQALPVVALNQAWQEARWLGQYVLENMFELALRALRSDQERWLTEISTAEELAENHYVGITSFLASLPYSRLTEQEIMDRAGTQKIAHEWREVARNLGLAGSNIARHRQEISALGEAEWEYLEEVYKEVAWLYLCTLGTAEKRAEQSGTAAGEQRLRLLREGEYRFIFREDSFTSEKNVLLDLCNYMYIIATHLRQIRERVIQG